MTTRLKTPELPSMATVAPPAAEAKRLTLTELPASAEMAVALLESADQAIVATDRDGRIVLANRHAEETFGYPREELLGSSLEMLLPEAQRHVHAHMCGEYLRRPGVRIMGSGMELSARRKDGSEFPVEVALSHIETAEGQFAIAFVSDVSRRKQLEQELMHAQKMEAVGRLAGGVAHDFNNMLTVIAGYGAMVLEGLSPQDSLRSSVEEILAAANRATTLTGQLLAFSRRQVLRPRVVNLNTLVASTERMLRRLIGENIVLHLNLQAGLGDIMADPGQIEHTIVNLVVNSRDAMPAGGHITVETENVKLDEYYARTRPGVQPGEFVMIAVGDTGQGMDAEAQRHVFEPFFTTKAQGKGTGLGLATAYGTVKQSGGDIWVYSELGKGTIFKLYFPKVADAITDLATMAVQPILRGSETVLVAEDEPTVGNITVKMLQQLGYVTLSAACGAEALELSKAYRGTIDLLLTDVVMPKMTGPQLAAELAGARPDIKVLYVSGYTENIAIHQGIVDPRFAFLAKPFSRDALAKAIRDVLKTDARPMRERHQTAKQAGAESVHGIGNGEAGSGSSVSEVE
jgi:two-component system, cell cycle sensor histidine kinase and response regulator CckA